MGKFIDLTGKKFGRLTVIKRVEKPEHLKSNDVFWLCKCSCSEHTIKPVRGCNLRSGSVVSCGCYNRENRKKTRPKNKYLFFDDIVVGFTIKGAMFFADKDDYNLIKNYSWCLTASGYIRMPNRDGKGGNMNALILNPPKGFVADHINGNRFNNRRCNLRIATKPQNAMNKKSSPRNKSGMTGVHFSKTRQQYCAQIGISNTRIHLGYYDLFADAVLARKLAEIQYFGEYARKR